MDLETIIAIVGALGVREALGQIIGIWQGKRRARLDDVQALWEENRQLRKELDEHRGSTDARIDQLEREIAELRGKACPWGRVDCPRERKPALAAGVEHKGE